MACPINLGGLRKALLGLCRDLRVACDILSRDCNDAFHVHYGALQAHCRDCSSAPYIEALLGPCRGLHECLMGTFLRLFLEAPGIVPGLSSALPGAFKSL